MRKNKPKALNTFQLKKMEVSYPNLVVKLKYVFPKFPQYIFLFKSGNHDQHCWLVFKVMKPNHPFY